MKHDPLKILREDTYSNEETNQMVGDMIRKQHSSQQLGWSLGRFPLKDEVQVFPLKNGSVLELNGRTQKAYNQSTGDILFSFDKMTENEFLEILANYNKE